ncbi:hypothetical protein LPJ59_001086 [Coemansia sp. RSA 2399]|nr:hypothetical protein LPJ59_001086 [Coemansia sp. RSA 2399]KAJ1906014.1 hypothetical protein LPJ81_001590 [Coemansia sp. IMI 209127]
MDSFLRNHFLYLLCSLLGTLASLTLSVVDSVSNWWHAVVCSLLGLLPKARVAFPVDRPHHQYHPAVLVTGTSSGIGHDAAIALASSGYTVFAGVRSWEDGARVESDFLDAVRPEAIHANRWARNARASRGGSTARHPDDRSRAQNSTLASESDSSTTTNGNFSCSSSGSEGRDNGSSGIVGGPQHMRQRRLRRLQKQRASTDGVNGKSNLDDCGINEPPGRLGSVVPVLLDVASGESIDQAYKRVADELKARSIPLVGVVNNAGVTAFGPMDISAPAFIDHCMTVNFHGPVRVTQRFMPLLRRSSGRIVNISSIMSWLIGPGFGVYCASKAALSAASRAWHYELASSRISVSVIEPGLTRTALWSKVESQLELHHARLNGVRVTRGLRKRMAMEPAAMPGDEAIASASPTRSGRPSDDDDDGNSKSNSSSAAAVAAEAAGKRNDDQALYNPMIRRIKTSNELAPVFALPTHHAVGAIMHALTSRYPKSTYRVGWDARLMSLATWLASEEAVEWLCRAIGIVSEN